MWGACSTDGNDEIGDSCEIEKGMIVIIKTGAEGPRVDTRA